MSVTAAEVAEVLAEGREYMSGLFTDTCLITKAGAGGKGTFNETTGQYDNVPGRVTVYQGPCRMQVKADINSNVVETTAGGKEWVYLTAELQLPATDPVDFEGYVEGHVDEVSVDNVVAYLTSPHSPTLEGRVFNVAGPYHKTDAVRLRFRIREVVGF